MKFSTAAAAIAFLLLPTTSRSQVATLDGFDEHITSALGPAPPLTRKLGRTHRNRAHHGGTKSGKEKACDPRDVVLADYPQWVAEKGYWIGEYTLYGSDGQPSKSSNWPYPYGAYKGFITGNIEGNAYRQRNVFLYPPANGEICSNSDPNVVGNGACGTNGNSVVFFADQNATTCSDNPELAGDVNGPYYSSYGPLDSTTELVGAKPNALLYQVYVPGTENPLQSQLTTLTKSLGSDVYDIRTRTAQGFNFVTGEQTYASFYRERKVSEDVFYSEFNQTIIDYNILDTDLCYRDGNSKLPVQGYAPGYAQCVAHLQSSFDL
jgi:hypothetical protein